MVDYCPHCGSENSYIATKPVKCEKCHKPFAAAFVVASQPLPTKPTVAKTIKRTFRKPPPSRFNREEEETSKFMSTVGGQAPEYEQTEGSYETDYEDDASDDKISDLAQSIAATLSEEDIIIQDLDEQPVKFGAWVGRIPDKK